MAKQEVFQILFDNDEVTWKQIIFGLIEAEQMNPWDIDISVIAQKFLGSLKTLKEMDFRISGKIVLASAILLKMKSSKLMDEEIAALDSLISSTEEPVELFEELPMDGAYLEQPVHHEKPQLVPRTPQPRKRKVSVYDLVEALEKALGTEARRPKAIAKIIEEPHKRAAHTDMSVLIKDVYDRVNTHYKAPTAAQLTFAQLLASEEKADKVLTFIPLLHLDFQRKLDIMQQEHFGEIMINRLQEDADFSQKELKVQ